MTDLMKDFTDIDKMTMDELNKAAQDGEGIRLPFPALYMHVCNGDARMKASTAPVQYFGGFESDPEKMGEMIDSGELPALPKGWASYTGVSRDSGNEYNAIGCRRIAIAVIKGRQSWLSQDGKSRATQYSETHKRRHLQYLTLFYQQDYVVPAVITAKGFQAQNLIEAVSKWESAIKPFRKELNALALPRSAFWFTVGTDGDKPNYVKVGSAAQSTITPITAILPAAMTADEVAKRFVGRDNLMLASGLLASAEEWLNAWKTGGEQANFDIAKIAATEDKQTGEIEF